MITHAWQKNNEYCRDLYKKNKAVRRLPYSFGAPEGTRTPDLLVRSQTLYPAELLAHHFRAKV